MKKPLVQRRSGLPRLSAPLHLKHLKHLGVLMLVPNPGHIDWYDRVDLTPLAKLTQFFQARLK